MPLFVCWIYSFTDSELHIEVTVGSWWRSHDSLASISRRDYDLAS
jgi:hypothetical protein